MRETDQLFYDENCPMCRWYSKKSVDAGMLEPEGRCSFSEVEKHALSSEVDQRKARNQIPLIIANKNTAVYGIDALLYLIGKRFRVIEKIGRLWPVHQFLLRLYKLISYNRRVVVPNYKDSSPDSSTPTFNVRYRYLFVIFSILVSAVITWNVVRFFDNGAVYFVAISAGWAIYFTATRLIKRHRVWLVLVGHASVTMLRGAILFGLSAFTFCFGESGMVLIPMFILFSFFDMNRQIRKRIVHTGLSRYYYFFWLFSLTITPLSTVTLFILQK